MEARGVRGYVDGYGVMEMGMGVCRWVWGYGDGYGSMEMGMGIEQVCA